jgi:hypothetical protein
LIYLMANAPLNTPAWPVMVSVPVRLGISTVAPFADARGVAADVKDMRNATARLSDKNGIGIARISPCEIMEWGRDDVFTVPNWQ